MLGANGSSGSLNKIVIEFITSRDASAFQGPVSYNLSFHAKPREKLAIIISMKEVFLSVITVIKEKKTKKKNRISHLLSS